MKIFHTALMASAALIFTAQNLHAAEPGPALTALGAKYGPSWAFKVPYLSIKAESPLSEDAWKEIAALGTKAV
ncbi:MAG: hypothetical protein ABIP20_21350, partial [Chthoniobacteraceae bacterium]